MAAGARGHAPPRGPRCGGDARGMPHPGATRGVALPGSARPRGTAPVVDARGRPTSPRAGVRGRWASHITASNYYPLSCAQYLLSGLHSAWGEAWGKARKRRPKRTLGRLLFIHGLGSRVHTRALEADLVSSPGGNRRHQGTQGNKGTPTEGGGAVYLSSMSVLSQVFLVLSQAFLGFISGFSPR